jgi:hypothetical protein
VDHEIAVRDVHEDDAPIVLRAHLQNRIFDRADFRFHDGRLYNRLIRKRTDGPQQVSAKIEGIQSIIWKGAFEVVKATAGQIVPPRPRVVNVDKETSLEEHAAGLVLATRSVLPSATTEIEIHNWRKSADAIAAKYIVVNDRAYELAGEPLYVVGFDGPTNMGLHHPVLGDPYTKINALFRNSEILGMDRRTQLSAYFNVSQEEQAFELLELRKKRVISGDVEDPRIELLSSEYRCLDTDTLELDRIAKVLLNEVTWGITLRSRSRPIILDDDTSDLINAVMSLKYIVDNHDPLIGVNDDLDIAMERVMSAAVGGSRTRPYLRENVRDIASYTIDRWRQRLIVVPSRSAAHEISRR